MEQNYLFITIKLLGALGLLIYGMKAMSDALQKMAGPQLRHVLSRITTNRFTGMLSGAFVTCAVQSSSATTVMTVSFVSAGLLTLAQAISVIMGANIGTTLTAWIMSLGYSVDLTTVVYPAFFIGILLIYTSRHRIVGDFLYGIAFMFLSLVMLSTAGKEMDLEHNASVVNFFSSFDTGSYFTIIIFLLIGTIITCIVQSSAAVMAITILLCSTGVLPIYLGIALVMGENIGTTATANLAALGANLQARRAALAHLLFNVFGVIWVLCVFYPFVDTICSIVGYDPTQSGQRAILPVVLSMFHTCFNVTNTAILIGFIPQMEKVVCRLLPEKKTSEGADDEFRLQYIHANLVQTPEISVLQAQKETARFAQYVQQMFGIVRTMLDQQDPKELTRLYEKVAHQEEVTDNIEMEIAKYLEHVSNDHLSDDTKGKVRQMLREISELESVGDACSNLARILSRHPELIHEHARHFHSSLVSMMEVTDKALTQMNIVMNGSLRNCYIGDTYRLEHDINDMRRKLKKDNIRAVDDHEYDYDLGTYYNDFINECEKLGDYVVNVVQARFGV
ncbi:MAG: Na/Pi cotransporter family protein [Prevotella sp.]|nr:Na/Pi cotransporter family protein [Prevotella sp.]